MTELEALPILARMAHDTRHLLRWSIGYGTNVSAIAWERNADLSDDGTEPVVHAIGYDHISSRTPEMAVANVRAYLATRFGYTDLSG